MRRCPNPVVKFDVAYPMLLTVYGVWMLDAFLIGRGMHTAP